MKLIIDIPEKLYKKWCCSKPANNTYPEWYIMLGTPLPKGHGRLVDADRLLENYDSTEYFNGIENRKIHFVQIGHIHDAPTIIEADKE